MDSEEFLPVRVRAGHQPIFDSGSEGPVWRVVRGVARLDRQGTEHPLPVWLALPGDLIGIESLCRLPYQFAATALVECEVKALQAPGSHERSALLQEALLQQQRRGQEMAMLRTGQVALRLARLLTLLGLPWQDIGRSETDRAEAVRAALPTLRDMALVVDAKIETVCRALAQLLPPRAPRPVTPRTAENAWRAVALAGATS